MSVLAWKDDIATVARAGDSEPPALCEVDISALPLYPVHDIRFEPATEDRPTWLRIVFNWGAEASAEVAPIGAPRPPAERRPGEGGPAHVIVNERAWLPVSPEVVHRIDRQQRLNLVFYEALAPDEVPAP